MFKVNGELFGNEQFHNGEVIYKGVTLNSKCNNLELLFEDNRDIANLIFAVQYIRDKEPDAKIELEMLYIPYSRMDREIPEGNQLFSMKYFAEILGNLHLDKVCVLDPHSVVSTDLFEKYGINYTVYDITEYIGIATRKFNADYLFFPDKGAYGKYTNLPEIKHLNVEYFYGTKRRDLANKGKIIEDEYELHDAPDLNGKNVLIVDDLVSMGGTAYIAAKKLKELGASKVALFVAHCENGVFVGKLLKPEPKANENDTEQYMVDCVYTGGTTPLNSESEHLIII